MCFSLSFLYLRLFHESTSPMPFSTLYHSHSSPFSFPPLPLTFPPSSQLLYNFAFSRSLYSHLTSSVQPLTFSSFLLFTFFSFSPLRLSLFHLVLLPSHLLLNALSILHSFRSQQPNSVQASLPSSSLTPSLSTTLTSFSLFYFSPLLTSFSLPYPSSPQVLQRERRRSISSRSSSSKSSSRSKQCNISSNEW
jgi:hypothetical protein